MLRPGAVAVNYRSSSLVGEVQMVKPVKSQCLGEIVLKSYGNLSFVLEDEQSRYIYIYTYISMLYIILYIIYVFLDCLDGYWFGSQPGLAVCSSCPWFQEL